ncbi:unnamed protein product [Thlaspi arvense]|uniref:Uncharacterized protein n=1 Tax=Thlaspi arvense TaxID=13288 RepID=A0AAU9RNJ7_THLAR|nr:unnamed protein product [Thlaspi arvense]
MAIEKHESQIALAKKRSSHTDDELGFLVPQQLNSLGSSFTDAIVIIDDDGEEKETLEPKKKKRRLGSWWDDVEAFNELSCVVKGLSKAKENDASSSVDSCFTSSTVLQDTTNTKKKEDERSSLSSHHHDNFIDLCEDDENKENQDSCFSSSTVLQETYTKKKDDERSSLPSHHHENFIDLCEKDEGKEIQDSCFSSSTVLQETNTKKKDDERSSLCEEDESKENQDRVGYGHVSIEEFGVTVEDLKSMPWEAFDPTWEIRSEIMDPWLGGHVRDIMDSSFSTSTTDLHRETKTKKEEDDERPLPSSHQDNFIDLSDDENVGDESNGHVSLEELGVTVEDLKSMPWDV